MPSTKSGVFVKLFEMKPKKFSQAHKSKYFAELVPYNSFKSTNQWTAAGQALAVNKELFSK